MLMYHNEIFFKWGWGAPPQLLCSDVCMCECIYVCISQIFCQMRKQVTSLGKEVHIVSQYKLTLLLCIPKAEFTNIAEQKIKFTIKKSKAYAFLAFCDIVVKGPQ